MALLAERTGRGYHVVDYVGDPEAECVVVVMGSGGETVQETVAALTARGERAVWRRCGSTGRSGAGVGRVAARDRASDRRPRPDEGTGLDRRAALPRHRCGAERVVRGRRTGSDAAGRRRSLRALVEGVHPRHGGGRLRGARRRAAASPFHDRHQRRCLRLEPRLRRVAGHRAARDGARDLRPRLGRDGRRQQEHDQDPRGGGPARAGLLRLRLEEVRFADRLAPPPGRSRYARRTSSSGRASSAATSSVARAGGRARPCGGRRDAAPQLPAPAG